MKITNFGPGIAVSLEGWSTGVTSVNSNFNTTNGLDAVNFVQRITSNTSNVLLNPIVNFASGTNIAFAASSNTLTISSTAAGGAGSISAGSNSMRVSEDNAAGASTTLWSPFDHRHAGIGTITSSSSNTMQRGTFNLRAGPGIQFALTDTDGDGELDTATVQAAQTTLYLGKNAVGATAETLSGSKTYAKSVTPNTNGVLLSIDVLTDQTTDVLIAGWTAAVYTDSSGPVRVFAANSSYIAFVLETGAGTGFLGRWITVPLNAYLVASTTYWITVTNSPTGSGNGRIFYDVGTDRTQTGQPANSVADWGRYTVATSARDYSIRGLFLSTV